MAELFYLFRHDTQQYYHALTARGYALWVDKEEQAQMLRHEEALSIKLLLPMNVDCISVNGPEEEENEEEEASW